MDKRTFIKTIVNGSIGFAAGSSILGCGPQKEKAGQLASFSTPKALPDRWVWLRPKLEWTDEDWKRTFERFNKVGIKGVLPQIYASNETLFDHPVLPVKKRWLEDFIPLAHSFGLEVHAWMWTMILNEKSMVEKHPDWYSYNRNGQPAHTHPAYVDYYKFMCPCNPEVQEFVAGNVEALAKIEDLDGVHLDYVRQPDVILAEGLQPKYDIVQDKEYPEYDYPYSENCRKLFKDKHGIDPMDLGDEAPAHEAWRQFRYDAVSNVVNNHCVPMARKYNKPITAAVFPNWESVRQQWHHWDLDGFLPMLYHGFYNEDVNWIGEEVKKAKSRLKKAHNPKNVYSGLFIPHLSPQEIAPALKTAKENGASGFSLFDLGAISEEHWQALERI